MIKFTIIFGLIYACLYVLTQIWVDGQDPLNKFRMSVNKLTANESLWFGLIGLMRILTIIFGFISAIILVVRLL